MYFDNYSAAVSSFDADWYAYQGKIYTIDRNETDFANALASCQRGGGYLAKITPLPVTGMLNERMSRFLTSRLGENCIFIGATDRKSEGIWVWTDGMGCTCVKRYMCKSISVRSATKLLFICERCFPSMDTADGC